MAYKLTFSVLSLKNQTIPDIKKRLDSFTDDVKKEVDANTPEDTKELLWNNMRTDVIHVGDKIMSSVYNETPYAKYVEYWVGRSFNYHKPKWSVFYRWSWAKMFLKAAKKMESQFLT